MLTPHEAACEHLKTLDRADHPEIEELLAVVRQYPVEVQRACEDGVKRGDDPAVLTPIKAVADRQAVAVQELLDALTAPAPAASQAARDIAALRARMEAGADASEVLAHVWHFTPDPVAGTFGGAPFVENVGEFEQEVVRRLALDEAERHGTDAADAGSPFLTTAQEIALGTTNDELAAKN